jgi:hypothetical protein
MYDRLFSLIPFNNQSFLEEIKIKGRIKRKRNKILLHYELLGNLNKLRIPDSGNVPKRQHELWQETCLEFFFGVKNSPQYWEVNLSPNGDWNIYHFENYRQGMEEEKAFSSLPFNIQQQDNALFLNVELDLNTLISWEQILEIAISAVIKFQNNEITYWALTHPGSEADFHRRDSFIINC